MSAYRFILLYAALGITFMSCNDWLDIRPETEQKEEDQFSSYKGFRSALTGCYMAMGHQDVYGEKLTMSHIESLAALWDFSQLRQPPYPTDRKADYYLCNHDYEQEVVRTSLQAVYAKLFNIIVQANKIIVQAGQQADVFLDEATRAVIMGEAYAIRAYCQLDVLRLFGEVPGGNGGKISLPYSEVTTFEERAVRCDFATYTQKLLEDLNKAENLLKDNDPVFRFAFEALNYPGNIALEDTYMGYRQARLNYWAVKALQARAYLYMGRTNDAYNAAKAIIYAQNSLGEPVMSISGAQDRLNRMFACPKECLFYLSKPDIKNVNTFLVGGRTVTSSLNDGYHLYISSARLKELFVNKDSDRRYYGWNSYLEGGQSAAIMKYYFADEVEKKELNYQIIPMVRMSEVYLIAIETTPDLAEANRLYAEYTKNGYNIIQNNDVFGPQTDRLEILQPEYLREFFAEGQMFYVYKRIGASRMRWCDDEITDEDYVLWNCINKQFNP